MRYLIDTQILIWLLGLSDKLPKNILKLLTNSKNEIFVSAVSVWEIAIKTSIGKLTFPFDIKDILHEIEKLKINILEINCNHLIKVAELPFHHKDPFDRLIISQAKIENLPLISSDNNFKKYDVKLIW